MAVFSDYLLQQAQAQAQLQSSNYAQMLNGLGAYNNSGAITASSSNLLTIGQFNPIYNPPTVLAPVSDDPVQWLKSRVDEVCWKGVQ